MNPKIAFRISLAFNVLVAGALVWSVTRPLPEKPSPVAQTPEPPPVSLQRPETLPVAALQPHGGPVWQSWLQKLRAAGVPDNVLGGLVVADFQNRWEKKQSDAWRRYEAGELSDAEREEAEAQHDAEQEKELKTALGDNGFEQWDKTHTLADVDVAKLKLSPSETDTLYQLRKELARKKGELETARRNGEIDPAEFNERQSADQQEYEKQFKTLLGDERYAAQQNPSEGMQGPLLRSLKRMNISGSEAENISEIQSNWNAQRLALDQQAQAGQIQGPAYEQQIQALDAARDQQYQGVLGTNGFAQLQEVQDNRYQTLKQYASSWQLSDSDVDYIYRVIQYRQKTVDDYAAQARAQEGQGQTVDWNSIQASIQKISADSEQAVNNYLGSDRFMKLKRNGNPQSGELSVLLQDAGLVGLMLVV